MPGGGTLAKAAHLEMYFRTGSGATVVHLVGVIDETFDGKKLVSGGGAGNVLIVDLDRVNRITSFGVREWINAFRDLPASYCAFVNVRPSLVAQFNMVSGFAGRGQLLSFYLPAVCADCEREIEHLIDLRRSYGAVSTYAVGVPNCAFCGGKAELDEIPQTYLAYVAKAPQPSPPPMVEALIDGNNTATGSGSMAAAWKIDKEVVGEMTALWMNGRLDNRAPLKRIADGLEGMVVVVLAGVTSMNQQGLERFRKLTESAGIKLRLARVTAAMANHLLIDPSVCGQAKIISFRFGFTCEACKHAMELDLEPMDVELIEALGSFTRSCSKCGRPLRPQEKVPPLDTLSRLPLEYPSEQIREYLREHPDGPTMAERPVAADDNEVWGRYRLTKQIGTGGMAQVFLARQVGLEGFEKKVVLKRMLPHLSENPIFVEMFHEEARLAARISHPNIVQIFDFGKVDNQYFIAMEYVRGWDLTSVMRVCKHLKRKIPIHVACRVISDVCAALQAAHRRVDDEGNALAIVHRDVSPQNILISAEGVTKLTDFGIAKAAGSANVTEPGMVRGKTAYMAPEHILGNTTLDGRVDIFAAGVVLWTALSATPLFERENQAATMHAVLHDSVPSIVQYRPEAPPVLDTIIGRALEKSPTRRYQSAAEFQVDLERFLTAFKKPASPAYLSAWLDELFQAASAAGDLKLPATYTPSQVHAVASHSEEAAATGQVTSGSVAVPKKSG